MATTHYKVLPNGNLSARTRLVTIHGVADDSDEDVRPTLGSPRAHSPDLDQFEDFEETDVPCEESMPGKKRRAEEPLKDWLEDRDYFLSEMLRLEGMDSSMEFCVDCHASGDISLFRCTDCDGMELFCRACVLNNHRRSALHRLEEWDLTLRFFVKTTLRNLGYVFRLGHTSGDECPYPEQAHGGSFTVLDINGVHTVDLEFCGCDHAQPHFLQLLRFGWFPATVGFPRTAFTFRLLKLFHILTFESKTTGFEFFATLSRLTDNTGTKHIPDRYSHLLRVVREYRHLKMLKRAGRGHSPTGALGTAPGECAVLCPACPRKGPRGRNLPDGFENAPPEKRFLYTEYAGLDANFRIKRRTISSEAKDPSLSMGWAYFVQENEFKQFLHQFGSLIVQEPSQCNNHDAVNRERGKEGFAATGVGTCDCIRHDIKRPTSVGDLQKGERYVNMDYLFLSTMQHTDVERCTISYDIACQWSVNLWQRMAIYPEKLHVDQQNRAFRFMIPKFHLPAHIQPCQTRYSFNFNEDVGRTDGEGVERGWAHINGVAASTREMGPGSRRDTLDDHFGDWNWKKTVKMGLFLGNSAQLLLKRVEDAVPTAFEHSILHLEFTEGLGAPDTVKEWTEQLAAWQKDHDVFNPFERTYKGLSLDAVSQALAEKESREIDTPDAFVMHESISASQLINIGLDLEAQQRRLAVELKELGTRPTSNQKTKWILKSNTLRRKIANWITVQHMYIPSLRVYRQNLASSTRSDAQDQPPVYAVNLFLPSSLPDRVICDRRLRDIEFQLRHAQCTDALDELRNALCLRAFVLIDKSRFQRGQIANTRSQSIVNRVSEKVQLSAEKYRSSRRALVLLSSKIGRVGWEKDLLELRQEDIRVLTDEEIMQERRARALKASKDKGRATAERPRIDPTTVISEGHRTVSWIWRQMGGSIDLSSDQRLHESLRIEWCKSKARADRWREEVELLQEEQRRVLLFFEQRAREWNELAVEGSSWTLPGVPFDPTAIRGREAYAREQAHQFLQMKQYCSLVWCNVEGYIQNNGEGEIQPGIPLSSVEDDEAVPLPTEHPMDN
ncbi:hypothetical protein CPC08DRAFT_766080 [Agrocybe pediades]|nr:hypothetical protein CPC08DRAFT_766080 [Agrocybe pediades]